LTYIPRDAHFRDGLLSTWWSEPLTGDPCASPGFQPADFPRMPNLLDPKGSSRWAFNLPTRGAADDLSTYWVSEPKPANLRDFFDFSGSPPKGKIVPMRMCPKRSPGQQTLAATEVND
jgi:hypothetical protein